MDKPVEPTTSLPPAGKAPPEGDLTGRHLGDFLVLRLLGQGGMGQVYLAEQVSLKRKVALKLLKAELAANPTSRARFKKEAEAVAQATHANIVQVYVIDEVEGIPCMALEYVEGRNLREYLVKKGPPDLILGLSILRQVAGALQRASELGIIHRDIKPENILLTRKGEVKVTDFGLSRCLAETGEAAHLTQSGITMGTPLYMSPEQVEGRPVDHRTDIYSLGVTCYHMMAGQPPYQGETAFEVALKHVRAEPKPLGSVRPDLPEMLCAIIHKMMAKDPAQRYQTGRELLQDVARLRETLSGANLGSPAVDISAGLTQPETGQPTGVVSAAMTGGLEPTLLEMRPPRRRWIAWLFVATILLAAMSGAGYAWHLRRSAAAAANLNETAAISPTDAAIARLQQDQKREQALSAAAGEFVNPDKPAADTIAGFGHILALGLFYLERHRPDDAQRLFERLDTPRQIPRYHVLGRIGRAITLALQNKPEQSNRIFKEIAAMQMFKNVVEVWSDEKQMAALKGNPGRVWMDPSLRYWVLQALRFNEKNGSPDKDEIWAKLRARATP